GRPGREKAQPLIDLQGVGVDDHAAGLASHLEGEGRLAAGRRTRYQNRDFPSHENALSVLCLIANPADPALDPAIVAAIHREVGGEVNWLNQRIACEIVK